MPIHFDGLRFIRLLILGIVVPGVAMAQPPHAKHRPIAMQPYNDETLRISLKIPTGWKVHPADKAVGFSSPYGTSDRRAAMGVMKSSKTKIKIEQAAKEEFKAEGQPADWKQANTQIGNRRAIRIVTQQSDNPSLRRLDIYVEGPDGVYLVQCRAPIANWDHYAPVFSSMISSLHFLP